MSCASAADVTTICESAKVTRWRNWSLPVSDCFHHERYIGSIVICVPPAPSRPISLMTKSRCDERGSANCSSSQASKPCCFSFATSAEVAPIVACVRKRTASVSLGGVIGADVGPDGADGAEVPEGDEEPAGEPADGLSPPPPPQP